MELMHTPGPWYWDSDPVKGDPTGRIRYRVVATGKTIAQTYYSSFEGEPTNAEADTRLIAAAPELLVALQAYKEAQSMSTYGDASDFVFPGRKMRQPGETAFGWICEKHGLGYQSGCICCSDEFKRHQEQKNRDARYARDDALRAAGHIAGIAIANATGVAP